MVTTQQRRETAVTLHRKGVSMRRGCVLSRISRNAVGYVSRRPSDDGLVAAINEARHKHTCYGYRRIHRYLAGEEKGVLNHKRVHRVWREHGMQHPPARRRKRRGRTGQVPLQAAYANHVWTYDFVEDATQDGRKLRFLTVIDEHNRRGIALVAQRSFKSTHVLEALGQAIAEYGAPAFIRSDNGPEFIAKAVKSWLEQTGIHTHYIDPASPWQNAFGESFNAILRLEFLNREVFATPEEARVRSRTWLNYYNNSRLHTSLGYATPVRYFQKTASAGSQHAGALPPHPQDLPPYADPVEVENEAARQAPPRPTVFGPTTALRFSALLRNACHPTGSLPSGALSSGWAETSIPWQPDK